MAFRSERLVGRGSPAKKKNNSNKNKQQHKPENTLPPEIAERVSPGNQFMKDTFPRLSVDLNDLPSKGKFYPEDAVITYRPYSFAEGKRALQDTANLKNVYDLNLKGIFTSFPKNQLLHLDFVMLVLYRKLSSGVGTHYQTTFECNNCGEANTYDFKIEDIETYDISKDFPYEFEHSLAGKVIFKPTTVQDWEYLFKMKLTTDPIAYTALSMKNKRYQEAVKIIENSYNADAEHLATADAKLSQSVMPNPVACYHCEAVNYINLSRWDLLVQPFRGSGQEKRDQEPSDDSESSGGES